MKQILGRTSSRRVIFETERDSEHSWIGKCLFTPIFAPLVKDRRIAVLLVAVATVQLWLTALGLPAWQCPILSSLGISCPGCGLSTAMVFLLRREWQTAISVHLFSPVFLLALSTMMLVTILPRHCHQEWVRRISQMERRTGFVPLLLLGVLIHWILKLLGFL